MNPEPKKMNKLLEEARPALLALPAETLERPRIARERAMRLTRIVMREFRPLLSRLGEELSAKRAAERKADFEALESRALIFYAADLTVENPWSSDKKTRRAELVKKVREHDETLSGWAVPLFRSHPEAKATLSDILRGRGIRDDADDTLRLVALLRKHWGDVNGKVPVTAKQLSQAETEATELLQILDSSDSKEGDDGSPRDVRRRAFTYWLSAYAELFHLGRYLARGEADVAQRFPGIAPERTLGADEDDDAGSDEGPEAGAEGGKPA
jgi:hypothetical protein